MKPLKVESHPCRRSLRFGVTRRWCSSITDAFHVGQMERKKIWVPCEFYSFRVQPIKSLSIGAGTVILFVCKGHLNILSVFLLFLLCGRGHVQLWNGWLIIAPHTPKKKKERKNHHHPTDTLKKNKTKKKKTSVLLFLVCLICFQSQLTPQVCFSGKVV